MAAGEGIAAFDPAAWFALSRQAMLADAGVQSTDLQRAVRRNRKLLNAESVKYFAHEGVVTDERKTPNHDVQARAVELFYDLFGVKAPRSQPSSQAAGMEVVIEDGRVIVRAVTR
jgi:hypothetical protein